MTTTTLYITRHGQTEWNLEKRMQGHKDSPLTPLGIQQAQWLGQSLSDTDIDVIYASSSGRTRKTAELVKNKRDIEIIPSDILREINMGLWEGQIISDLEQKYPEQHNAFWKTPHLYESFEGESFHDLHDRVIPYLKDILSKHRGQTILIVTHGLTLKTIMSYFEKRKLADFWDSPHIYQTSLSLVELDEQDEASIRLYADTSHYKELD
ncbi:histidine phosphatase family protein [Chengkuizengella axinellae]|uniref:Histidine phosphatase family protein n=1 Tax=Chengkuizengella axinellae TaxID=3064388 RepID=A0ABT9IY99_9BACL|nr:histidine phosphatase family protein [Chengkuizengella sp. 2205SS18-9]MDP5274329.1 histidine phosphatase family protein [Chengkuizengella sp. 2205SS18-9]